MAAVGAVLDHSRFILGPEVDEFESRFAEISGTHYAVGRSWRIESALTDFPEPLSPTSATVSPW